MTTLAKVERNGMPPMAPVVQTGQVRFGMSKIWDMAGKLVEGRVFPGVTTQATAFSLMMLCDADGMHPAHAMRRYHIIQGRFSMRADAMQAEFQQRGGRLELVEKSRTRAAAMVSHPAYQPKPVLMEYTIEDAIAAGDVAKNPTYKSRPRQMLWARLVSEVAVTIDPGVRVGTPSAEELEDIVIDESPRGQVITENREAARAVTEATSPVPGWDGKSPDTLGYREMVKRAVAHINSTGGIASEKDVHKELIHRAINLGYEPGPAPTSTAPAVTLLSKLYQTRKNWVRDQITEFLALPVEPEDAPQVAPAVEDISQDDEAMEVLGKVERETEPKRMREPGED